MNPQTDLNAANLSDCGCCEGIGAETPVLVWNRPGLPSIAYRTGTWAQFKSTMLARFTSFSSPLLQPVQQEIAPGQLDVWPLQALQTRSDDDFTIALTDAFAVMCDVLTFYQERLVNESYFGTATQSYSLRQLARLVGYQLSPGVAASVYLAFTLDDKDLMYSTDGGKTLTSTPYRLSLPAGIKAQSVPAPGDQPNTYETIEAISARTEWNALAPLSGQPQALLSSATSVWLAGTSTNVKIGDTLLIQTSDAGNVLRRVVNIALNATANTTRLDFQQTPETPPSFSVPGLPAGTSLSNSDGLNAAVAEQILLSTWQSSDLEAIAAAYDWSTDDLAAAITSQASAPSSGGVYVLRQRAALYGHNAPSYETLPAFMRVGEVVQDEKGHNQKVNPVFPSKFAYEDVTLATDIGNSADQIYLDTVYSSIVTGGLIALTTPTRSGGSDTDPNYPGLVTATYTIEAVAETTRADLIIAAKVSVLTLNDNTSFDEFGLRQTSVLAQSDALPIATLPIIDDIKGSIVALNGVFFGLEAGQNVILTGTRTDLPGVLGCESCVLEGVAVTAGYTVLTLVQNLAYTYQRSTVLINANVAAATHGESVPPVVLLPANGQLVPAVAGLGVELLGSGNSTTPFQTFTLSQPPLTYISSPDPSGSASTLQVRVNGLLWNEAPMLYGQPPTAQVYALQTEESGGTTVMMGDGVLAGARIPSGQNNVTATYRKGIGSAGNVDARRISLLLSRPQGLKDVTNPLPATGGADPDTLATVQQNAPLSVMTLDRVVSLQDYQDFSNAFAGIGKALATATWTGLRQSVFLTVAGVEGAAVPNPGATHDNLVAAILASGDSNVPITVSHSDTPAPFRLSVRLTVDPRYQQAVVFAAVAAALQSEFSFDNRSFGQPVFQSEIMAIIQAIPGVIAAIIPSLYRTDGTQSGSPLMAAVPQSSTSGTPSPAELLLLDTTPIDIEVM